MAQLDKAPNGMTLGELSQRMMVSNGNVTGLVDRLVEQNMIERRPSPTDRRAMLVNLTPEGRKTFRTMARTHEGWIAEIFEGLTRNEMDQSDAIAGQDQSRGAPRQAGRRRAMIAANPVTLPLSQYKARHVRLEVAGKVATLTLNRPEKKNPLTFESYDEIANIFRAAAKDDEVKAFVHHRRRRQFLFRRRRVRDHRPAGRDGHGRACSNSRA